MVNNPLAQAMGPGAGATGDARQSQAPGGGMQQAGSPMGLGGPAIAAALQAAAKKKGGHKAKRITKGKHRRSHKGGKKKKR